MNVFRLNIITTFVNNFNWILFGIRFLLEINKCCLVFFFKATNELWFSCELKWNVNVCMSIPCIHIYTHGPPISFSHVFSSWNLFHAPFIWSIELCVPKHSGKLPHSIEFDMVLGELDRWTIESKRCVWNVSKCIWYVYLALNICIYIYIKYCNSSFVYHTARNHIVYIMDAHKLASRIYIMSHP